MNGMCIICNSLFKVEKWKNIPLKQFLGKIFHYPNSILEEFLLVWSINAMAKPMYKQASQAHVRYNVLNLTLHLILTRSLYNDL